MGQKGARLTFHHSELGLLQGWQESGCVDKRKGQRQTLDVGGLCSTPVVQGNEVDFPKSLYKELKAQAVGACLSIWCDLWSNLEARSGFLTGWSRMWAVARLGQMAHQLQIQP